MNVREKGTTIDLIRNIVMTEMIIPFNRIILYNQDWVLPPDDNLWAIVSFRGSKLYSNNNKTYIDDNDDFVEEQCITTQEQIAVTLMSYNLQALQRKEEVPMSLVSIYSQQVQNRESFKIAPIVSIVDLSDIEGGKINYRFDILITVLSWYTKTKKVLYYENFPTKITVNGGLQDMTAQFNPAVRPTP